MSVAAKRIYAEPASLETIAALDSAVEESYRHVLKVEPALSRQLVSYQANKETAAYRWYKYKEAFSAELVRFLLRRYPPPPGDILDPFCGMGTTLFAASAMGYQTLGIELLPIGQEIVKSRILIEKLLTDEQTQRLNEWCVKRPWSGRGARQTINELRITQAAYPDDTRTSVERYLAASNKESDAVSKVLRFALLCVLEEISYTRKDGQYLRWDYRSGRRQGAKKFDKGRITPFDEAIAGKLRQIVTDARNGDSDGSLFGEPKTHRGQVGLLSGSCLDTLPTLKAGSFAAVVTSPPYCNRYDYTRSYALELALLGVDEEQISKLRQNMLSCTVENRAKDLLAINRDWKTALKIVETNSLLQEILAYLEALRERGELNNTGIPRMVRGYFCELACVIQELSRVLVKDGLVLMVNDNVRYAGASISVDLILSSIAERLGLKTEAVLVLPNGKGNSSQQMGEHGRKTLRKCVLIWRKT